MKDIFLAILNMSLTGSAVILLVLAARLLLKRTPKIFSYALWSVVLFRLLCPVSLPASISLLGWLKPEVQPATPVASTVSYLPDAYSRDRAEAAILPQAMPAQAQEQPADSKSAPDLLDLTSCIWLAGVSMMALCSVLQFLRLRGKLVGAVALRDGVYLADSVDTPFVMGIFRPRVYLPSGISGEEQSFILAHEKQHIRRGDPIWKLLGYAALCLHWFNPLVWAAFILAAKDMEMSCDEAVIRQLGSQIRADYSAALLRLTTRQTTLAGVPLAFGEGDTKGRIRNMARWKKPKTWVRIACLVLCLGILMACGLNPRQAEGEENTQVSGPATIRVGELFYQLPEGLTYEHREDGGIITDGTNVLGGDRTFPMPADVSGWDWLQTLDLWEWEDETLGYYADSFGGDRMSLEFFSDVPEGVERTVLRQHELFFGSDRIYDLWFDELLLETSLREEILSTVKIGPESESVASSLPYEIGTLPESFSTMAGQNGDILLTNGTSIVGGITGYPIPEGVYDPYDEHFDWLEKVGIPDYEDSTLIFMGGITSSDGGWKVTFASNVPAGAEITVMRTHRFTPSGNVVYDFWLDEILVPDLPTRFAIEEAVHCLAPVMEQPEPRTKEELAFAKCRAVMDAVRADSYHIFSDYQFETDTTKSYTLDSYWNMDLGYLSVPHPASTENEAMLYAHDRVFTGTESGGEIQWMEQNGFEYTGPWLESFDFIRKYVTYLDTLESGEGEVCTFLVNAPFADEDGEDYLAEFEFDAEGNFVKVQLRVNSFLDNAFTLTESIVTLDADAVTAEIEREYQRAIL